MQNNTRGFTYSTSWVREEKNYDDDDDGTVRHRLSHLITRYEHYNEQYINQRHRSYCCIDCLLLFSLFYTCFAVLLTCVRRYPAFTTTTKLKQTKLGQFSTYWTETGQYVHEGYTYNIIRPIDRTVLPRDRLKKQRLGLKIVLGQTWFEFYSPSYHLPCDHSIVVRIG